MAWWLVAVWPLPRKPTCRVRPNARGAPAPAPSCMLRSGVRSRLKAAAAEGKEARSAAESSALTWFRSGSGSGLG